MQKRIEIYTRGRNITISLIATLTVTLMGILCIVSGASPIPGIIIFIVCLWVLFSYFPKAIHKRLKFVLTPETLEYFPPYGSLIIPWDDVEKIGIVKRTFGVNLVGLRLNTYDHIMEGMSTSFAKHLTKMLWLEKGLSITASQLDIPTGVKLWSKLEDNLDFEEMEKGLGSIWNLFEYMLFQRKHYGFDIIFDWAELDRSPSMFVELLENYRVLAKDGSL